MTEEVHCASCRFHSKVERPVVLGMDHEEQAGLDFEQIAESETETECVYTCRHESRFGQEVGVGAESGRGCHLHESGKRSTLPPTLLRLLERHKEDNNG